MKETNILMQRLLNQHITGPQFKKPSDMVRWMTAVQAQDFLSSLWARIRVKYACVYDVEDAIADKSIIRTWLLRSTLYFVSSQVSDGYSNLYHPG
jgi:hypothetical protein